MKAQTEKLSTAIFLDHVADQLEARRFRLAQRQPGALLDIVGLVDTRNGNVEATVSAAGISPDDAQDCALSLVGMAESAQRPGDVQASNREHMAAVAIGPSFPHPVLLDLIPGQQAS